MNHHTSSYDEVPYESHPYAQSHPDRLAVIAQLFGMSPAPVARCRVLELGCAAGGNLIPLAAIYPNSRFVGIDSSSREIDEGRATIARLQLGNIELRHQDILAAGAERDEFDYVICHGVYSWVPRPVQDSILEICARQLQPQGVAYVSYNTYPGWHLRGTARDIMEYHARKFDAPAERVQHARALLDFLVKSVPQQGDPYGLLLKGELELLRDKADSYVLHEHLESINSPVYFYQFDEHAHSKGLRYLGEAELGAMSLRGFPEHVAQTLHTLTDSFEEMEQYLDFLRNRMFRQTLLCRQAVQLDRRLTADRLQSLHVAAPVRLEGSPAENPTRFAAPGGTVTTNDPLFKVALIILQETWPAALPFERLVQESLARLSARPVREMAELLAIRQRLAASLIDGFARRFIQLHSAPLPFATAAGDYPQVCRLARLQAGDGRVVTNLRHQLVELDDLARRVAVFLDGTRGRPEIVESLLGLVQGGTLSVQLGGQSCEQLTEIRSILAVSLEQCLTQLSRDALLLP